MSEGSVSKSGRVVAIACAFAASICAQRAEPATYQPRDGERMLGESQALRSFARLRASLQTQVLDEVEAAIAALPPGPWERATDIVARVGPRVRARAAAPRRPQDLGRRSETGAAAAPLVAELPVPARVAWRFGSGRLERLVDCRSGASRAAAAQRVATLAALCRGEARDLDRALAALLQRLDVERGFDAVALLLETWKNGEETMYDALDRSAGTGRSVFHADAMLDDFVRHCVPREHPDHEHFRASRDAAYVGFRRSFEAWRSRRSTMEMVALTCLLGPDTPLPERLARYESGDPAQHSTRELVELIVIAHGGDVVAACDAIAARFEPLTTQPWEADADGWRAVHRAYAEVAPELSSREASTFEQLAAVRRLRREARDRRAHCALEVVRVRTHE